MRVDRTMTRDVIWVRPDDLLADVYELMKNHHFRHVPVMQDSELVGILSQGDILLQAVPDSRSVFVPDLLVEVAMTADPITCQEESTVAAVADLMIQEKIDCVPVLRRGKLVGLVTSTDLLQLLVQKESVQIRKLLPRKFMFKDWRELGGVPGYARPVAKY